MYICIEREMERDMCMYVYIICMYIYIYIYIYAYMSCSIICINRIRLCMMCTSTSHVKKATEMNQ